MVAIELGYRLVSLAEKEKGAELLQRVRGVRKTLSEQMGFLLPEVRIRDNLHLEPDLYQIKMAGVAVASGVVDSQRLLAIDNGQTYGKLDGELTQDPAFGLDAVWIRRRRRPAPESRLFGGGCGDRDRHPSLQAAAGTARRAVWSRGGGQAVGPSGQRAPKLAEDLNAALTPMQRLRVYRQLLKDQVSLVDIRTIATTLLDACELTKEPILLASDVRCALKRSIVRQAIGERRLLATFTLDDRPGTDPADGLEPGPAAGQGAARRFPGRSELLAQLQQKMPMVKDQLQQLGHPPVLVVMPQLRPLLARYARSFAKGLKVLSYNEIPEHLQIEVIGSLG
jgi:flagellar biosynthesis protein FlhA